MAQDILQLGTRNEDKLLYDRITCKCLKQAKVTSRLTPREQARIIAEHLCGLLDSLPKGEVKSITFGKSGVVGDELEKATDNNFTQGGIFCPKSNSAVQGQEM